MARDRKSQRSSKPSIKYKCGPLNAESFELVDFDIKDYVSTSDKNKNESRIPGVLSSQIFSTRDLISAIGSIWDSATCPFSALLQKSGCKYDNGYVRKRNVLGYCTEERRFRECISADKQIHPVHLTSNSYLQPLRHPKPKYLKAMDKISSNEPPDGTYPLACRFLQGNLGIPYARLKDISSLGIPFDLDKVYWWPSIISLANPEHQVNFIEKHKDGCVISDPPSCRVSPDKSYDADNLMRGNVSSKTDNTELGVLPSGQNHCNPTCVGVSDTSVICEHFAVEDSNKTCTSQVPNSKQCSDSAVTILSSCNSGSEGSESSIEPDILEEKNEQKEVIIKDGSDDENFLSLKEKPHHFLATQKHAFAGAMAGIFVSTCLHPVDTIKTVVQSRHANQKSLLDISRSIISERGIKGLYRGISTNIASSAPISAVYTYTYESAKGTLLPFFPKEHQSLVHCLAGGCASLATSFIFTPSERIKQQMQVGLQYQNCWNALIGIIEKGGLPSLYAGWRAVLCRNIPHSIIKFYTYESWKQLLSSVQLNGQTNTLVTLVSGGLAGSTAALFTTPFDVIKTRLQTQNPGSINQQHGLLCTLKEIAKSEGLKGLFRGLTPRLFMYMTQGALFFASYESFKKLFSLEVPEIKVQTVPCKNTRDDRW